MNALQKELQELKSGLGDVVQVLGFLQGFIESEFGMRFQFQAYKAASPGHERLASTIQTLQDKLDQCNRTNTASIGTGSTTCPTSMEDSNCFQQQLSSKKIIHVQVIKQQPAEDDDDDESRQPNPDESYPDEAYYDAGDDNMESTGNVEDEETSNNDVQDDNNDQPNKKTRTSKRTAKTNPPPKKKRKKKEGVVSREEMKNARMRGEAYIGSLKVERETGKQQWMLAKPIPSRKMGPTCTSPYCLRSKLRNCTRFTEEDRSEIFKDFWQNKDWDEKKAFACSHVQRIFPKQPKPDSVKISSRSRKETLLLFLPLNGERLQVCKNMFLSTTGVGGSMLENWVRKLTDAPPETERPVRKRKYKKHSERIPPAPKMTKDGCYKCPYCLELSSTRSEFQSHMAKHMNQFTWSNS